MAITKVTTDGIDMSSNSGGLTWAKGTTAEQPGSPVAGELRENTETAKTEVYDGTEWDQIVGGVTSQNFNGDGSTTTFTLDRSTTTAAALIMLNGVVQNPGTAYNMSPSPSTNLVFTEAPAISDKIDIRFL